MYYRCHYNTNVCILFSIIISNLLEIECLWMFWFKKCLRSFYDRIFLFASHTLIHVFLICFFFFFFFFNLGLVSYPACIIGFEYFSGHHESIYKQQPSNQTEHVSIFDIADLEEPKREQRDQVSLWHKNESRVKSIPAYLTLVGLLVKFLCMR
jgi:predicted membrane protein